MDRYNKYQTKQLHAHTACKHNSWWWLVLDRVTTKEYHPRLCIEDFMARYKCNHITLLKAKILDQYRWSGFVRCYSIAMVTYPLQLNFISMYTDYEYNSVNILLMSPDSREVINWNNTLKLSHYNLYSGVIVLTHAVITAKSLYS